MVVAANHLPPELSDTAGHTPTAPTVDSSRAAVSGATTAPAGPSTATRFRYRRHQPRTVVYGNVGPKPAATDRVPRPAATAFNAGPITSTESNLPTRQNDGSRP